MEKLYWTTKQGIKILIDDMSEEHLRNVLKMLVHNHQKYGKYGSYMNNVFDEADEADIY